MPLFGRNPFRLQQAPEAEPGTAPVGAIVLWSGTNESIPSGWALCDGSNGTPDLRGRFVAGIGDGVVEGVFGSDSASIVHSHSIPAQSLGSSSTVNSTCLPPSSSTTTGRRNSSHTHTLAAGATSTQTGATLATVPSYWALAFIQKQ